MEMESVSVTHVTFMHSSSLYAHSHILFVFFLRFPPNAALVIDAEIYDGADFRLGACLGESFLKCSGVL